MPHLLKINNYENIGNKLGYFYMSSSVEVMEETEKLGGGEGDNKKTILRKR